MKKKIKWDAVLIAVAIVGFIGYMILMEWITSQPVPEVDTDVIQYPVHTNPRHSTY